MSRKTRDEEKTTKGGGVDVVFKFVTKQRYEFFTIREIIKAAVNGYVSTIKAKVNAKQNVIMTIIFSVCDNIFYFSNLFG